MARNKSNTNNELKVTAWDTLGDLFRGSVIATGAVAGAVAVFYAVTAAFAYFGIASAATVQTMALISSSILLGGGWVLGLIAFAGPALVSLIVHLVSKLRNGKIYNNRKQKALLKKLSKELKKNKQPNLTQDQILTLQDALNNPDMTKLVDEIGREKLNNIIKPAVVTGNDPVVVEETNNNEDVLEETNNNDDVIEETNNDQVVVEDTNNNQPVVTQPTTSNEDLYKNIQRKSVFTMELSVREKVALYQIYSEEKKTWTEVVEKLKGIENPTEQQVNELKVAQETLAKFTVLEKKMYKLAKDGVSEELQDPNNIIDENTRKIYVDFQKKGRKSKATEKIVVRGTTETPSEDEVKAKAGEENITKIVTARKSKR